jgi:hypothetical protein
LDQPQYSDDEKFYWNGHTVRVRPARWRYWFWTILIGGIALIVAWGPLSSPR